MKHLLIALMLSITPVSVMAAECLPGQSTAEVIENYKNAPPVSENITVDTYEGKAATDLLLMFKEVAGLPEDITGNQVIILDQPDTGNAGIAIMQDGCMVRGGNMPDPLLEKIILRAVGQKI